MSNRTESYGEKGGTLVDRYGAWLSSRAIQRYLPPTPVEVLDIGCGYRAAHLVRLGDRILRGVGIDFTIAPELLSNNKFTFIIGGVEAALAQLQEQSFDVVLLNSVLEHLSMPDAILQRCHDFLRPGGRILINVPTWRGKWFLELSAFRLGLSPKLEMDDHKMYYDKRDLWPMLVKAGFLPSAITLKYHKFGLNLFATALKR